MHRLRVTLNGRERVIKYPQEAAGTVAGASRGSLVFSLLCDAFDLNPFDTDLQFVDARGHVVTYDSTVFNASDTHLFAHVKRSSSTVPQNAGQGLVGLLGDNDSESSATDIMRSLLLPLSLKSKSSQRGDKGYTRIADDEGTWHSSIDSAFRGNGDDDNDDVGGGGHNNNHNKNVLSNRVAPASEFAGKAYQGQLVKFNRILAHLVNERTVLAWFRTNLALVSLSFKYMKLAESFEKDEMYASTMLFICGGIFAVLLPVSWWSGYSRYEKCKELLDSDIAKISTYLHKMGFDLDNSVFFMLVFSSFLTLSYSSTLIIWTSDSPATAVDDLNGLM